MLWQTEAALKLNQFIPCSKFSISLMVASAVQMAKRALLVTMHAVAMTIGMTLTCNRDSTDAVVVSNFRKLALRVHPDRPGGSTQQQQQLKAKGARVRS